MWRRKQHGGPRANSLRLVPGPIYVRRIATALRERFDELVARITDRVTAQVPEYLDPGVQAGYGESVRMLASMIVQGQWLEGRQLSVEDEEQVRAVGTQRARQGVELANVKKSLRVAEEVGMELLFDIAKDMARSAEREDYRQGLDALEVMRSQLRAFIDVIQDLMASGYSERLDRDPPTISAQERARLAELGHVRGLAAGVAVAMAKAVWDGTRYADFKQEPGLRQEIEAAMAVSTQMFFTCLAESRQMTPEEAARVGSFASHGAHLEIPTDVLEEAMRDAAGTGFLTVTYSPAVESDDRVRMAGPIGLALQAFTYDLIRGVRDAREREGRWIPLVAGLWLDSGAGRVRTTDGRGVTLARREYEILKLLSATPGTYHSSLEIGQALGSVGGYPMDPAAIKQAVHRLRRKLRPFLGEVKLIDSRHGIGYTLVTYQ